MDWLRHVDLARQVHLKKLGQANRVFPAQVPWPNKNNGMSSCV